MRAEGWRVAVAMLRDHPLLGIGPGRYPEEQPRYSKLNDPAHAYNILLHTGAELGGLGLAAYALIWGRLLVRTLRRMRGSTAALTAFAAHAMLLTFLLRSQSEHFLANLPASFRMLLVAGFLLGLAEAASRRAPRESDGLAL
jgi:O-antigen ligase